MCVGIFPQESIFFSRSVIKQIFLHLWAGGKGQEVSPGTQGFVGSYWAIFHVQKVFQRWLRRRNWVVPTQARKAEGATFLSSQTWCGAEVCVQQLRTAIPVTRASTQQSNFSFPYNPSVKCQKTGFGLLYFTGIVLDIQAKGHP